MEENQNNSKESSVKSEIIETIKEVIIVIIFFYLSELLFLKILKS
ncbi:MAG: hypothetical protein JG775_2453 [Defluviitaleaceae bacterium]|jgi:hypothetical protein|nr:hypothetical protein [Defluviitaleaceae bacterium]